MRATVSTDVERFEDKLLLRLDRLLSWLEIAEEDIFDPEKIKCLKKSELAARHRTAARIFDETLQHLRKSAQARGAQNLGEDMEELIHLLSSQSPRTLEKIRAVLMRELVQ